MVVDEMVVDKVLQVRVKHGIAQGVFQYAHVAIPMLRRLVALTGQGGTAIGIGERSLPVMEDLSAQSAIEQVHVFGVSRRSRDRLFSTVGAGDTDCGFGADLRKFTVRDAGMAADDGPTIDGALEGRSAPCGYLVATAGDAGPSSLFGALSGARKTIDADRPVLLVDMGGVKTGQAGSDGAKALWDAVADVLPTTGYTVCDGFGGASGETGTSGRGAGRSGDGVTGVLWAFPGPLAEMGPKLVPFALAKGVADASARSRPI